MAKGEIIGLPNIYITIVAAVITAGIFFSLTGVP